MARRADSGAQGRAARRARAGSRLAVAAVLVTAALSGCAAAPGPVAPGAAHQHAQQARQHRQTLAEAVVATDADEQAGGPYELVRHDGTGPVRWPACRAIEYRVNTAGMPSGMLRTVRRTMALISRQTGVALHDGGRTGRPFASTAKPSRPTIFFSFTSRQRSGDRASGVPGEVGLGGPSAAWTTRADGTEYEAVVLGRVRLWSGFRGARTGPGSTWQSLIVHEVGHALNLAHRDAPSAAMHPTLTRASPGRFTAAELASLRATLQTRGCDDAAWRAL